jgi:putative hydrolase of the HAD superfamily
VNRIQPRGVILDFGGVLTSDFFEVLRGFCRREGLPQDSLLNLISIDDGAKGVLVDLERGAIGQPEFEAQVADLLRVPRAGLLRRIMADLQPNKPLLQACKELRRHGIKVGVLSNSWGSEPFDPYEPWRLEESFDSIVISHRVGLRKPDPRIFELAAHGLGLAPEECMYVDDIAVYLEPAREMGMRVVHHADATTTIRELETIFMVPLPI